MTWSLRIQFPLRAGKFKVAAFQDGLDKHVSALPYLGLCFHVLKYIPHYFHINIFPSYSALSSHPSLSLGSGHLYSLLVTTLSGILLLAISILQSNKPCSKLPCLRYTSLRTVWPTEGVYSVHMNLVSTPLCCQTAESANGWWRRPPPAPASPG